VTDVPSDLLDLLLRADIYNWNRLRAQAPDPFRIERQTFNGLKLDGADLHNCSFEDCAFTNCDFNGAKFSNADLIRVRFYDCDFLAANFFRCDFSGSTFERCDFADTTIEEPENLHGRQFRLSSFLTPDNVPRDLARELESIGEIGVGEDDDVDDDDDDDGDDRPSPTVDLQGQQYEIPKVPSRIPAPIEVIWEGDVLRLHYSDHKSLLGAAPLQAAISAFRQELEEFARELKNTNVDSRISARLEAAAANFPAGITDFEQRIFEIWFKLRPVFSYGHATKGEQLQYIHARFLSLEGDLRDILSSFPEWREYELHALETNMPEEFDFRKLRAAQAEFSSALGKFPEHVDGDVTKAVGDLSQVLSQLSDWQDYRDKKFEIFDVASSNTNVISRILKRVIDEVIRGGTEGIRDGTKAFVTGVMVAGGGTLVWLITKAIGVFDWLWSAWEFVRHALPI
jgi:hypothetical protein